MNVELKVLKALCNFAIKCRCARENPVSKVSFYREVEKKPRFLQKEEIKELARLIEVTSDTIINWELRDVKPTCKNLTMVRRLLGLQQTEP